MACLTITDRESLSQRWLRSSRGILIYPEIRSSLSDLLSNSRSPPSASFGQTLQFITSIKLAELEKQRVSYKAHSSVLERASLIKDDPIRKVEILLEAVRSWSGSGAVDNSDVIGSKLHLRDLDLWLLQAKKDPSFSVDVLNGWAEVLEAHVRHSLTRLDCAQLFGKMFNEWLASGDSSTASNLQESLPMAFDANDEVAADEQDTFVQIGRKEMHEQKARLKSIIFQAETIDTDALSAYLTDLFSSPEATKARATLCESIEASGKVLLRKTITATEVSWSIDNLLASDLMDESKRSTLREFTENPTVLDEVASVFNMRLANLDS